MSGSHNPYWQPYAYHPDGRPLFLGPPDAYPPSLPPNFSPHAPPPQYPFYPVHDAVFGPDGVHPPLTSEAYPSLDVPQERKHRRSRNGCFTCRTRRVKCDEKRPSCDRCRKGCRECVYPSPNEGPRKKIKSERDAIKAEDADSPTIEGSASPSNTASVPDFVRDSASETTSSTASTSVSPKHPDTKSLSPASRKHQLASRLSTTRTRRASTSTSPPSTLSTVIESPGPQKGYDYYFEYSRTHLTHHNYGLSHPAPDLIPGFLFAQARAFKPLLHAVTAFAAYACALREENTSLKDFIFHYAESVADLRLYLLENRSAFQIPVLLTILQLATIEEYLGDWVNLINHQMAAFKVMTSIWDAQSIMQDQHGRLMLNWYNHFDLFTSYMGGRGTALGREWFQAQHLYYEARAKDSPNVLELQYAERHARLRLLGSDIATYFTELSSGQLSGKTIERTAAEFRAEIFNILKDAGPLVDASKRARSKPCPPGQIHPSGYVDADELPEPTQPPDADDPGNPWDSTDYYIEPLWSTNYLTLRCYGVYMMLVNHLLPQDFWRADDQRPATVSPTMSSPSSATSSRPPRPLSDPPRELRQYAIKTCQLFAALCNHDPDPAAIMGCQPGLSLSSCFIGSLTATSKAPQHIQWAREQLMRVECYGYIFPMGMRKRISDAWGVDVTDWWFPEGQGLNDTLRAVREFVVFRTRLPDDDLSEDVREMNGLFAALKVGEDSGSGGEDEVRPV